jgi:ribonuclease J
LSELQTVEIVPLGGLGEFGMNMLALRCNGTIIVIDAGLMFPREDVLLGVDVIVPELTYLLEHRHEVRAVILTHGHEDHIGALSYLLEEIAVPVYGTPLTLGFARGRLEEHGLTDYVELHPVAPRDVLEFGDFKVECLSVTHSIADAIGLAIETPAGTIIHTGDFKFDQSPPNGKVSDYARLAHFGEKGVALLMSDSTNSERPGYTPSECQVKSHLELVFHTSPRKIVVACFASSIHRIQIILDLAREFGRRVVPVGRSMKTNIAIARDLGHLKVPPGVLTDIADGSNMPDDRLVLLCTGSQGEPMAALARLALGEHKDFTLEPGDSVIISARVIPGNETRVSHLVNHFCRRGARVYDENRWSIHVSGHASQEELKLMLNLTRPHYFVPIHGEYRQLYHHALVAREAGIPEDRIILAETGDILNVGPEGVHISGRAPTGRRLIDEGGLAEIDEETVRDRQRLSAEGVVLAVVPISKSTGELLGSPELVSRGHQQVEDDVALLRDAGNVLVEIVAACTAEERADSIVLTERVRAGLKRFFRKRTAKRPMIVPMILEV